MAVTQSIWYQTDSVTPVVRRIEMELARFSMEYRSTKLVTVSLMRFPSKIESDNRSNDGKQRRCDLTEVGPTGDSNDD